MSTLKEVQDFLSSDEFKEFTWPKFNKADIEKKHKINEVAKGLALRGQPAAGSEDLSNVEQEVISDCTTAYNNMISKAKGHFKKVEDSINALIAIFRADSTEKALEDCKQQHDREIQGYHDKLKEKNAKVKREEERYEKFQLKNDIIREAQPYTSTSLAVTIALVVGLLLFEIAVNTGLVGLQAEGGALEGLFTSVAIAFLNVVVSSLIGYYLVKKINLIEPSEKGNAVLFRNLYIFIIFYVNFVFSAYRAVIGLEDEQLMSQVIIPFMLLPYYDFQSIVLFFIGMSFAGIAMYDGYKFDDVFPHYGQMKRNLDESINKRNAFKEAMSIKQEDIFDRTFKESRKSLEEETVLVTSWRTLINRYEDSIKNFKPEVESIKEDCAHMVNEFRTTNKYYRGKTAQPAYFDKRYSLDIDDDPKKVFSASYSNVYMEDDEATAKQEEFEKQIDDKKINFNVKFAKLKDELRAHVND